ncbi:MAG: hypothetical protein Q9216_001004 [Gyalolechia sp. 2 TL-2023]
MSVVRSNDTGGEMPLQSHVLASLFSFSGEAQDELLPKLCANTLASEAQVQWLNNKYLLILSDNEATVTKLFDLYAEYISTESKRIREPYEVQRLERPLSTIVKSSNDQDYSSYNEAFYSEDLDQQLHPSLATLVAHEAVSRVWQIESQQATQLRRCLSRPSVFQDICKLTNCRLVLAEETNTVTVKGDNDEDLNEAIGELKKLGEALSILDKPPQIYHCFISEAEIDVSLQIQLLDEASDQIPTDVKLLSSFLPPERPKFGVVIMLKKGRRVTAQLGLGYPLKPSKPSSQDFWRTTPIIPHGDQIIDCSDFELGKSCAPSLIESRQPAPPFRMETFSNLISNADLASGFVEQWVEQTSEAKTDPFDPAKDPEDPFNEQSATPDAMEAIEGKHFGSQSPKKRYGRNRKAPGGQIVDDTNHSKSIISGHTSGTNLIPINEAPILELVALTNSHNPIDEGPVPDPTPLTSSRDLIDASTNWDPLPFAMATYSSSETRSHGASQKSTPLQVRSGTPSTQVSANPKDLLTGERHSIAYPVMDQAPAIHGSCMPPVSSQASVACDFQSNSGTPAWLKQNPTTRASSEMKGSRLIAADREERPSSTPQNSYLEAAKRGALRSRGSQRGRTNSRSRLYANLAPSFSERLQSNSEVQSRQVFRTMHQKMAKPNMTRASLLKGVESATAHLLQPARAFRGVVDLEVEIGRILVKGESNAIGRTFSFSEWPSVFAPQAENRVETIFSNRLPISDTDIQYLTHLNHSNGRQIFDEKPSDSTLKYHFLCRTRSEDQSVILEVHDSNRVEVLSTPHLVGAINWHFPKRQWDARLAVKISEQTGDYQGSVDTVTKTLSIVPSADGRTAKVFAETGNPDLIFKSATIIREIRFACRINPDIVMLCSEMQYLGPAKERHRYYNSHKDVGVAKKDGDLWWEVRLRSTSADHCLQQNRHLRLGDQVGWTAEDIMQGGAVEQLHDLTSEILTQIDGLGGSINTQVKTASMDQNETKDTPTQPGSFW